MLKRTVLERTTDKEKANQSQLPLSGLILAKLHRASGQVESETDANTTSFYRIPLSLRLYVVSSFLCRWHASHEIHADRLESGDGPFSVKVEVEPGQLRFHERCGVGGPRGEESSEVDSRWKKRAPAPNEDHKNVRVLVLAFEEAGEEVD